jgi:hypothetical protein
VLRRMEMRSRGCGTEVSYAQANHRFNRWLILCERRICPSASTPSSTRSGSSGRREASTEGKSSTCGAQCGIDRVLQAGRRKRATWSGADALPSQLQEEAHEAENIKSRFTDWKAREGASG